MKICDHFKLIMAIAAVVMIEKIFVIPVSVYMTAAVVYAIYTHKDEIINFVKSKF